jgi:hypothetical protein
MIILAILAILLPMAGVQLLRLRKLEIKVMNGLLDRVDRLEKRMCSELSSVTSELHDLKALVVSLVEQRGG